MRIFGETICVKDELIPITKLVYELAINTVAEFTKSDANDFINTLVYNNILGGSKKNISSLTCQIGSDKILKKCISKNEEEIYSISIENLIGLNINPLDYNLTIKSSKTDLNKLISEYIEFNFPNLISSASNTQQSFRNNTFQKDITAIMDQDEEYLKEVDAMHIKNIFLSKYSKLSKTQKKFTYGVINYVLNRYLISAKKNEECKLDEETINIFKIIISDKEFITHMDKLKDVYNVTKKRNKIDRKLSEYHVNGGHIIPLLKYVVNSQDSNKLS